MELTGMDIEVLLECLKYSIQRVSEAQGTPYAVRQENLGRLCAVQEKLRQMRREGSEQAGTGPARRALRSAKEGRSR